MTRTTGASVDTYSYQGTTNAVVRIANTGGTGVITDSIPDPAGDRLGTRTGSVVAWLVPDLHGSVAAGLAQTPSSVSDAIRYDGYGQTVAVWPTSGSPATASWKYQGRLDLSPSAIPLYAAGARDYAPGLGMFTSLDTVAGAAQHPLSMNRFLYAEANPATLVDPSGHLAKRGGGSAMDYGPQPDTCTSDNCTGHPSTVTTSTSTDDVREAASHSTANRAYAASVMAPIGPTLDPTAGMTEAAIACMRATPQYAGYCMTQGYGQGPSMTDEQRTLYLIWLVASPLVATGCVLGGCEAAAMALGEASLAYGLGVPIGTAGAATSAATGLVSASALAVPVLSSLDTLGGAARGTELITNERPVIFKRPLGGSTAVQDAQIRAHVDICNEAYCAGALSPTGRVSTEGTLARQAGRAAEAERAAHPGLYPDGVVAGHGPDTTWTGNPIPFKWQPLDQSVNASLGAQAQRYAPGYQPTGFWFIDDYVRQFGALPGQ